MDHTPLETGALLDLTHTLARPLLEEHTYPWQALPGIAAFLRALGPTLPTEAYAQTAPEVWIARDAIVAPSASITGPCIICPGAEIRHCAFIRGSVLVGAGAVVGNSTELKNALLFDGVQVPHYNYVGDSILGHLAHMGAGAITSNVKSNKTLVTVRTAGERIETGLKKFGAILGDGVEVGCNSVLCPGAVIGRGSIIYPTSCVRGAVPPGHIYKRDDAIVPIRQEG